MNIKETFLKATEYLTPHTMENTMDPFLPENIQKDSIGNYYTIIGETKTMFCCHLDNYTWRHVKVNKILYDDGKKVKTDGKTPLGSDDKAGMVVMLNMIEHNVPGCYYFFLGEETSSGKGGVWGSKSTFRDNKKFFEQFERCVAFDRKGYSSIISRMSPGVCCSKEFVDALVNEFAENGLEYRNDPTGVYTDSAVFMSVIPEVTNISCGGFHEHYNDEYQDLEFLVKIAEAACKVKWESLPTVRKPFDPYGFRTRPTYDQPKKTTAKISKGTYKRSPIVIPSREIEPEKKRVEPNYNTKGVKEGDKVSIISGEYKGRKGEIGEIDRDGYYCKIWSPYGKGQEEVLSIRTSLLRSSREESQQKKKEKVGLFSFKSFSKKKSIDLYETIKSYLSYYGYNVKSSSITSDNNWVIAYLTQDLGGPKTGTVENNPSIPKEIDLVISSNVITINERKIGTLADFENTYRIGFASKFYPYVEEFLDDLFSIAMKTNSKRISDVEVEKVLKKYGDFRFSNILNNYSKLFDSDDFSIREKPVWLVGGIRPANRRQGVSYGTNYEVIMNI